MTAAFHGIARARSSLRGLAVGDAFGSQFFIPGNRRALKDKVPPPGPWQWTDDTEMACSVVATLVGRGRIDQDELASGFARHLHTDRGYGPAVRQTLRLVKEGGDWRILAAGLFDGRGSWGNGAAMRVAPLGAYFAGEREVVAREAELSATVTHTHPEAVAGAIAVAVAASVMAEADGVFIEPAHLLEAVMEFVPRGAVHRGVRCAAEMVDSTQVGTVAAVLGCGREASARDTVPFALWVASRHLEDFTEAMWATALAGGDVDTTSAIVGGLVAAGPGGAPPPEWERRTERLPSWAFPTSM